jgi:trehalose 6-phosphate phosphatase
MEPSKMIGGIDGQTSENLAFVDKLALFLDLDGTLAPIASAPDRVALDFRVVGLLARLMRRLGGRVAIVSGRSIADVDRIVDGSVTAVAGIHGLERRTASGVRISVPAHPQLAYARAELLKFADPSRGIVMEDKGLGIALHFRGAPEAAVAVRGLAFRLATSTGLAVQEGDMVVELRTPGPDKGSAVAAFMAEPPFLGSVPVFVGDDLTDEDAFAATKVSGGLAIRVGPERESHASHRLADVDAVVAWLDRLLMESPA